MLVLRWTHILSSVVLVGGLVFLRFALIPSLSVLSENERESFQSAMRSRWAKLVMACSGLLLLSGLANMMLLMGQWDYPNGELGLLTGLKLLLSLPIFFISSLLAGKTALADKIRQKSVLWLNVNLILAVLLICLAGLLRFADRVPKAEENQEVFIQSIQTHPAKGENA